MSPPSSTPAPSDALLGKISLPLLSSESSAPIRILHLLSSHFPPGQIIVASSKSLSLTTASGLALSMPLAVLTEVCRLCSLADPKFASLLPSDPVGRATVGSYFRLKDTSGLDGHLASRSFAAAAACAGPTLADLGLYYSLFGGEREAAVKCGGNVSRWYDAVTVFVARLQGEEVAVPDDDEVPVFYFPGSEEAITAPVKKEQPAPKADGKKKQEAPPAEEKKNKKTPEVNKKEGCVADPAGDVSEEKKAAVAAKRAAKAAAKADKKKKGGADATAAKPAGGDEYNISSLDIRVGRIIRAWEHESAEKLYCEEIDVGEDKPRNIASGLRSFYKVEEMQDRRVLVLCNLKARNLVGFPSHGMVLCASNADHTQVKMVIPPESATIGERVAFEGFEGNPEPENRVAKKKVFEKVAPDLKTDDKGSVVWKGVVCTAGGGVVVAEGGMAKAQVS